MRHSSATCKLEIVCFDREREDLKKTSFGKETFSLGLEAKNNSKSWQRSHPSLLPTRKSPPLEDITSPFQISPLQEQNIPLYQSPKDLPCPLCYSTRDVKSHFIPLSRSLCLTSNQSWFSSPFPPAVSRGRCTFTLHPFTLCWEANNGIHMMLHRVALTSTVVVTACYRLQSACRQMCSAAE